MLSYMLYMLPPAVSVLILLAAYKKNAYKPALVIAIAVTMAGCTIAFNRLKLTVYGLICCITIPPAVIYILVCLFLSIKEDRQAKKK